MCEPGNELKAHLISLLCVPRVALLAGDQPARFSWRSETRWQHFVASFWGYTTKWIPAPLILIVILLKRTALRTFCKILEALYVGLVKWK